MEDATISLTGVYNYSIATISDGSYFFENILAGDYSVECFKEGYNSAATSVTIEEKK